MTEEYPKVEWKWVLKKDLPFMDTGVKLGLCRMYPGSPGFFVQPSEERSLMTEMFTCLFTDGQDWLLETILDRPEWIEVL